jgi:lipoate-protein ligase A
MRFDEGLAEALRIGTGAPTVRLYQWQPWAVSLGYHQDIADIDALRCAQRGIDIVRRPTGGRAILHAEELTYSVVMLAGRRSILQVYNDISDALVKGLNLFGVEAALRRSQPNFRAQYRTSSSIPCFASSARYEIEWKGRKLVGSAQRRYSVSERDVVLQHGSILCGPAHQLLVDVLSLRDDVVVEAMRKELQEKTTDLSTVRGAPVNIEELSACIKRGFEIAWGITLRDASAEEPAVVLSTIGRGSYG